jgi:hypothetical protein
MGKEIYLPSTEDASTGKSDGMYSIEVGVCSMPSLYRFDVIFDLVTLSDRMVSFVCKASLFQHQHRVNIPFHINNRISAQHLPQTTCASFLINRLLNDREDGNQHPPFSPEFELDHWNDDETENTDRDGDEDDDNNEDITDNPDLCSKRVMQASDML